MNDFNQLLKQKDELLKFKQQIINVKSKYAKIIDMKWDNEASTLIILKCDQFLIKSFNPTDPFERKEINLPERADNETKFYSKMGKILLSFKRKNEKFSNHFYSNETGWKSLKNYDSRIECLYSTNDTIRIILFNESQKIISLIDEESRVIQMIEEVERMEKSINTILLIKSDASLTVMYAFILIFQMI